MPSKTDDSIKGIYRHYKGQSYRVMGLAHHSETLEPLVLYEAQYENPLGSLWVRPKEMFFGKIIQNDEEVDRFARGHQDAGVERVEKETARETYTCYAECIIESRDQFLVITRPKGGHAGGLLSFPGGKLEHTDCGGAGPDIFLGAARREVLEEVGINLKDPLQYVTSNFFYDKDQNPVVGCVFYCKIQGDPPRVIPSPREVPEYQWLTREEVNSHPNSPPWIKRYLSMVRAFENVEIVKADSMWAAQFSTLKKKISDVVGHVYRIEHIGSTAVPELAAKGIIDMQLGIESFENVDPIIEKLMSLGLTFIKDFRQDHIPLRPMDEFSPEWEKRFVFGALDGVQFNLHIRNIANPNWEYALLFRDFLTSNKSVAAAYSQLKTRLSELPINRRDYTYAKDPAVDLIYLQAKDWAQKTGWKTP